MDFKPKNVPEELKNFLQEHPTEWFTNEQLAERLSHTPSGIRNAVTKLKSTGLIKTRMTGSLAYRGWHTAPPASPLPVPEIQKRMAARRCNGCATTYSRYWRSDLEEPNGWLCNNCGMNQRRGRGINRVASSSSINSPISPSLILMDSISVDTNAVAPSAEEHFTMGSAPCASPDGDSPFKNEDGDDQTFVPYASWTTKSTTPKKRRPPIPSYVDPSKRKCGHCGTTKSAGKWRRDREIPDGYLCNKCGMNQRRAQFRLEQQRLAQEQGLSLDRSASAPSVMDQKSTRLARLSKTKSSEQGVSSFGTTVSTRPKRVQCCNLCEEQLPTLEVDVCQHRICGECIPTLIRGSLKNKCIQCPICATSKMNHADISTIPIGTLGTFFDSLL